MSGPLRLPTVRSATRRFLALARTLQSPTSFCRHGRRHTRPVLWQSFTPFFLEPSCSGFLRGLSLAALRWRPHFWGALLRLATSSVPNSSLCKPELPSLLLGSVTTVLFLFWRSRVLTSASTSRFSEPGLQGDRCSSHLAEVLLASDEHGSCLVAPCRAFKHRGSP